jgi:hypothetical protein
VRPPTVRAETVFSSVVGRSCVFAPICHGILRLLSVCVTVVDVLAREIAKLHHEVQSSGATAGQTSNDD